MSTSPPRGLDPQSSIFGHLAMLQTEFEEHPFFRHLEQTASPEWMRRFVPGMGFWVMTFQDVLRRITARVKDPTMLAIARHIRAGDDGHDDWFVTDMAGLGLPLPSFGELFGPEHQRTRDASFEIMSEVFHNPDDRLLVVLLLALESASYVFFGSMTNFLESRQFPEALDYFGRHHLDAEMQHGIVEAEMDRQVEAAVEGAPELHAEAIALINRVFASFSRMFDGFIPDDARGSLARRAPAAAPGAAA
jgi:hypothetical protein